MHANTQRVKNKRTSSHLWLLRIHCWYPWPRCKQTGVPTNFIHENLEFTNTYWWQLSSFATKVKSYYYYLSKLMYIHTHAHLRTQNTHTLKRGHAFPTLSTWVRQFETSELLVLLETQLAIATTVLEIWG